MVLFGAGLLFGCVPVGVSAQRPTPVDYLTVDLASGQKTDTASVPPGRYVVRTINLVPRFSYTIRVLERFVPVAPLPQFTPQGVTECSKPRTRAALRKLDEAASEEQIPAAVAELQRASSEEAGATTPACAEFDRTVQRRLSETVKVHPDTFQLRRGRMLVVMVTRVAPSGETKTWEKVFTTDPRGEWHVTYGFGLPITRGFGAAAPFSNADSYFAEQVGDSTFVIRRGNNRREVDIVPAVFYSYVLSGNGWRGLQWNPLTAGLGVDLTKPTVLVGTGITYNKNLSLTFGASVRSEKTLLERYAVGDTVTSNLTTDQLHESVFRFRPFIAVTFRFERSPFSRSSAQTPASAAGSAGSANPSPRN